MNFNTASTFTKTFTIKSKKKIGNNKSSNEKA